MYVYTYDTSFFPKKKKKWNKAITYAHKFSEDSNIFVLVWYLNRSFQFFNTITCLHSYRNSQNVEIYHIFDIYFKVLITKKSCDSKIESE